MAELTHEQIRDEYELIYQTQAETDLNWVIYNREMAQKDPKTGKTGWDAVSDFFNSIFTGITKSLGKGAANLTEPLVNQIILILVIVIIGIFVLGKSKILKVGL